MDPSQQSQQQVAIPDQVVIQQSPLELPLSDEVILQTLQYAEQRGRTVRQQMDIDNRAKNNTDFWRGRQVDISRLDRRYQEMHVDNVLRESLENKIKLATGHVPDIFISPPDRQGFNTEAAQHLQSYFRDRLTSSTTKRILKNGLRKLDLDLIAILKCRYDPVRQTSVYELLESKNVLFGEGSRVNEDGFTIEGTHILFHYVEEETQQVLNRFPKKADELMRALGAQGREIPSRITYTEAHFDWYDNKGGCNQGVACRYGNVLLDSFKQPYFDYDNEEINYFDRPRKNFILFSYCNLGDSVYEATTDTEQGVPLNRIINRRRRQITEISDRAVPKLAFLGGAITKQMAENISPNPAEGILLDENYNAPDGDIGKAMAIIPAAPPNPILYNDLNDMRGRLRDMFATHGNTMGQVGNEPQSGISKQISREGDLLTSDDISAIVLERVIFEMASWEMQFLRLFQDDDRPPLRITNAEGETDYIELNRNKVETDVQVVVKASSVDKQTRRADAIQLLGAQAIDPYSLLEDIGVNNPRERLRRLVSFIQASKSGSLDSYMQMLGIDMETPFATADDAQRDIAILQQGQEIEVKLPSEAYVAAFNSLVNSPQFHDPRQWSQYSQQLVIQYVNKLKQLVDQQMQQQQQQISAMPPGAGMPQQSFMPQIANGFSSPQTDLTNMLGSALAKQTGASAQ